MNVAGSPSSEMGGGGGGCNAFGNWSAWISRCPQLFDMGARGKYPKLPLKLISIDF